MKFNFMLIATFTLLTAFAGTMQANEITQNLQTVKPKIAVLNFTTIDIQGQKFYLFTDKVYDKSLQSTITNDDRETIDDRMLGLVKMIDSKSEADRRAHDRLRTDITNNRNYLRYTELADKILKSNQRSVVIGAEYMIAELDKYPNIEIADQQLIQKALAECESGRTGVEYPHLLEKFGRTSGATHVLYATVGDFFTKERKFKGYGVETSNIEYSLDVLFKLIELSSNKVVFSQCFSGTQKELSTEFSQTVNPARFKELMQSAIAKAAPAIDAAFAVPTTKNAPAILPEITIAPRGAENCDVEIIIDGNFKGKAPMKLKITPGAHKIAIKADGYFTKTYEVEIEGGETFAPELKKLNAENITTPTTNKKD